MKRAIEILVVSLSLLMHLGFARGADAGGLEPRNATALTEVAPSPSAFAKERLQLVSFVRILIGGRLAGTLVAYDDNETKRPADYLELYDPDGRIVAIGWFDRFGIERVAIDRAVLEQGRELAGVLVVLVEGEDV
ncbi:MAG TPA: hypothetical protein VNO43_16685 [Candidatus Eisenbacteria bacterium]|nr:hypothetical protein [Candidatus Eisenbacteria bacterium]